MEIRPATLDDIVAITEVHKGDVPDWYRGFGDSSVPAPYETLSVFERYMAGGPWMSVETCAIHVNQLLLHDLPPIVVVADGQVVAEAEFYIGEEGAPYGKTLDISVLYVHPQAQGKGIGGALLTYLVDRAERKECRCITVVPGPRGFYQHYGFSEIYERPHLLVNARKTNLAYAIAEIDVETPWKVVTGLPMPIGRYTSSRQEWERHKMITYHLPELATCLHRRVRITTEQAEAVAILGQHSPFDDALVAHAWTANMPVNELVSILRNECIVSGYNRLRMLIDEEIVHTPLTCEPVERDSSTCMVRWLQPPLR
ncbi:MAG: GNAT family N-acetyltransferase [Chloroflexi bacterium]|nr:GNAT family N-acetyltransferase [Chloroflexota bacterium]